MKYPRELQLWLDGREYEEIASITGQGESTVRSKIFAQRKKYQAYERQGMAAVC